MRRFRSLTVALLLIHTVSLPTAIGKERYESGVDLITADNSLDFAFSCSANTEPH